MQVTEEALRAMSNQDRGLIINFLSAKTQKSNVLRLAWSGILGLAIILGGNFIVLDLLAKKVGEDALALRLETTITWVSNIGIGVACLMILVSVAMTYFARRRLRVIQAVLDQRDWQIAPESEQALYETAIIMVLERNGIQLSQEELPQSRQRGQAIVRAKRAEARRRAGIIAGTLIVLLVSSLAMWIGADRPDLVVFGVMPLSSLGVVSVVVVAAVAGFMW